MMQKKKILLTTTRVVHGGGVEKNIYYTIKNLLSDYEFHLSSGPDYVADLFEEFTDLKTIICPTLVNTISPIKDLKALWFYYKLFKKEKYDIVHTHETKASFITKLAGWLAKCPFIIYGLHGVTFNDPMPKLKRKFLILLEKSTINCADIIVAVGQNTIDAYHNQNIGNKIPFQIVRSGFDFDFFFNAIIKNETQKITERKNLGISETDIVLITVGRFSFSKAQRYLIESFSQLQKKYSNIKFILIGEGELLQECKALANTLQIPNNSILFLGYQTNIPKFLSLSDIFVFSSLREGLPRVIVEAALVQLPVAMFDVEGANEILENNKTGFISPQGNLQMLTENIEKLIVNKDLRNNFGAASQQHVLKHWDMNTMVNQLREIYNKAK